MGGWTGGILGSPITKYIPNGELRGLISGALGAGISAYVGAW